ncbi:MAG: acetyl-CoA decarbonylase/synthase complex subunit delta [Anaerolineae bacterium]|nr:acetyl-CoA decarbonylase/synthase complex subunit delta [Anaerolineae bacterium]
MIRRALVAGLSAALKELGGIPPDAVSALTGAPAPVAAPAPAAPAPEAPAVAPPAPAKKVELPPDPVWIAPGTKTEIAKDKWTGKVREITLGATAAEGGTRARTVTVGGESAMPFLHFEGQTPHPPAIALEIVDKKPEDWSPLLLEAWGDVMNDPAQWARAAESAGADLLLLRLSLNGADGSALTPAKAVDTVKAVLQASGLPLIVFGPGQAEVDNQVLVPIAEATKGERLLLGICEDKNYRTIAAAAMANNHLVNARASMDVNLSKQLNIMISDMGLPLDRIIMDPTTASVGYGFEYGYSVMERLRMAALQGDSTTQLPILVTPGEEVWRTKEAKVGDEVPAAWGDWKRRAINFETLTAVGLIQSGANIVVLRHPETLRRVRAAITDLMTKE